MAIKAKKEVINLPSNNVVNAPRVKTVLRTEEYNKSRDWESNEDGTRYDLVREHIETDYEDFYINYLNNTPSTSINSNHSEQYLPNGIVIKRYGNNPKIEEYQKKPNLENAKHFDSYQISYKDENITAYDKDTDTYIRQRADGTTVKTEGGKITKLDIPGLSWNENSGLRISKYFDFNSLKTREKNYLKQALTEIRAFVDNLAEQANGKPAE